MTQIQNPKPTLPRDLRPGVEVQRSHGFEDLNAAHVLQEKQEALSLVHSISLHFPEVIAASWKYQSNFYWQQCIIL